MKIYSVVLALVASLVVGCGDGGDGDKCQTDECSADATEQAALCCHCANPPPGCDGGVEPTPVTKKFALGLWNGAAEPRTCSLSYTYHDIDGSPLSGSTVDGEQLPSRFWRGGLLDALAGTTVTMAATCQHPNYPTTAIRASRTITTFPMDRARTCRAIYSESPTPTMTIPCWEGRNVGPVPGIEFVTVVRNNSASTTTVNLAYTPLVDGGGATGPDVLVLSGHSITPSLHTRTGIFAPIGGVAKVRLTATTNGISREFYADVLMDDPSVVFVLNVNADGSVSASESTF